MALPYANRDLLAQKRSPGIHIEDGETTAQWAARAGLNWTAMQAPVLFEDADGINKMADRSVLYRSDNRAPLGVVSNAFKTFQPAQVVDFYADLTERHGFKLTDAGVFKGGKQIWAKATTGDVMRVHGNDVLQGYVLLSTSFDGSLATTARFSTLRLVCENGLTIGEDLAPVVRVSHRSIFDADAAKITLGVGDAFIRFQQQAEMMADRSVSIVDSVDYFLQVYRDMKAAQIVEGSKDDVAGDKVVARLAAHLQNAPGANLASARSTVWGLLNAVTYDIDHVIRARSSENRDASAMFGAGERIKNKARDLALAMAA